jgi:SAM-dependent methyltransferase
MVKINNKEFNIGEVYQDIYGTDIKPVRSCYDRYRTIMTADKSFNSGALERCSVCDIGSNFGYFLFKLAEKNFNSMLGVEINKNAYKIANEVNDKFNVSFINDGYEDLQDLNYDAFLCLSIFHHNMEAGFKFLNKISDYTQTIYIEQALHLEWAYFGKDMICDDRNPYHFWIDILNKVTGYKFNIRLIGVHRTHLNTIRPMYQLKRKISEEITINEKTYNIYDSWNVPYMNFGMPRVNEDIVCLPREKRYMYATCENKHYFLKQTKDNVFIMKKHEGFLLSEVLKWGMLPFYNRDKIRTQLKHSLHYRHLDATPWNFIIDEESNLYAIDYNDNQSFIS